MKKLHDKYTQKSRIFLYPALDIRRGSKIKPIQTYIAWEEIITPNDKKLICVYDILDTEDFQIFERVKLLGNKLFCEFRQTKNNKGIYIFTFDDRAKDWDKFVKGKYSQLSDFAKSEIENFYGTDSSTFEYVMSYLHPEDYFDLYADLLGVDINILKAVGELCAPYSKEKETLQISVEDLEMKDLII
jgi:hypothetical protein